jgi:putative DNA primase/helicase
LLSGNITPAALFRSVEAWKPTLLIDEADTFAAMHDELRGILNAGHTRDTAYVIRAEGDANEPRIFSTWAPKVVAAIGHLPDTIEDRSIRCVMARKPTSEIKQDAFDSPAVQAACGPVRTSSGPLRARQPRRDRCC